MPKPKSLALKLIEKEKREKTGFLDLGRCGLTEFPEELGELVWLEELMLSNGYCYRKGGWVSSRNQGKPNNIAALPDWLHRLKRLQILYFGGYWDTIWTLDDLSPLAGLSQLQSLGCFSTQIADLSPLASLSQLQSLYCSSTLIADLSPLAGLNQLQSLDCSSTLIADLSPLAGLSQLQSLSCSSTVIADLSPLAGLSQLQSLSCYSTLIADLSPLAGLNQLQSLDCSETRIADLSPLAGLSQLQSLYCSETLVADLSPLARLSQLQSLGCAGTPIADLSPLTDLSQLQSLGCSSTPIVDLSPLANLSQLQSLYCFGTQIADLSPLWPRIRDGWPVRWDFDGGNGIYVENCPLIIPPVEFAMEGPEAVVEYFEQLDDDSRPLNEIKVIFLGEGASGKTSLIKRLRNEAFDPKESQTHGILIRKTPFDIDGETITAHLWDFGGQEVMHATHQFFLSQRCIYVLVLNSRTDDKAEYWLKHASSFGGNSPVLVILNKIDENPSFEVNRKGLAEKYSQIQRFFRLSCKANQGIQEFRDALATEIARADTRRTPFPAAWLAVKEHFAGMDQDYIDSAEYRKVCAERGVNRPFSQAVLLQFLHDLGVVINFRNLRNFDTQILNPLWLTNGVYRIINSELVANQGGLFHEHDFDAVINDPRYTLANTSEKTFHYPLDKLNYIVRVMEEFELCYPLDRRRHIVPQLLPVSEPDFQQEGAVLHFIIRFPEFLPDSIFPRLMVKLHGYIKGELRWRTGMVLEKRTIFDAAARVRADKEDKEIRIDVCGAEPRRFLSYIRETVKEIVADFANLPFEELVPIPDSDLFRDYNELVDLEKMGEKEIAIGKLKRKIAISDLLNGVEEPEMRDEIGQIPVKAFVSYSHKDMDYLQALRAALSPLVRLEKLRLWDDRAIDAGAAWEETIFRELNEADLVLCLVSQDFIASEFCYTKELAAAMDAHAKGEKTIVPIRIRECHWEDLPLAKIQGTPGQWIGSAANKDTAWTEVAKRLEPAIAAAKQRKAKR